MKYEDLSFAFKNAITQLEQDLENNIINQKTFDKTKQAIIESYKQKLTISPDGFTEGVASAVLTQVGWFISEPSHQKAYYVNELIKFIDNNKKDFF